MATKTKAAPKAEASQAMYAKVPDSFAKLLRRAADKEGRSISGQFVFWAREAANAWVKKNPG